MRLMQKSACNVSYPNMYMMKLLLSVIIKPVQPTYHQVNINMPASMITHAKNPKADTNPSTWRMLQAGGRKIRCPQMDDYVRRGKKRM